MIQLADMIAYMESRHYRLDQDLRFAAWHEQVRQGLASVTWLGV